MTDPATGVDLLLAQAGRGAGVPIRELLLVMLTAAVITFLATGGVRLLALWFGAVAVPRERDVHTVPIPRMGGVGIYLGLGAALLFAGQLPALQRGFEFTNEISAALVAGLLIVAVGIVDDRWGLDALTKFVGQVTAAGVMVVMGLSWFVVYAPIGGGTIVLDQLQAGLVTVAVAVVLINAMNFVDGLDGLAAGLGLIASVAICIFSVGLLHEQGGDVSVYPPAMLAAALAGACLGFLPHNFQPARIFMGDSGSMLIGLMLAAISTSASGRIPLNAYGTRDILGLLSPLLLVGRGDVHSDPRPAARGRAPYPCRSVSVQPRQDAPAPPTAADRALPSACRVADLSVGRSARLRCGRYRPSRSTGGGVAAGRRPGVRAGRHRRAVDAGGARVTNLARFAPARRYLYYTPSWTANLGTVGL